MDASESPLSTSPSPPSYFSPQRHFYLAVDRLDFKMETLLDLLSTAGRRPCLPMVVCCSTRDELDAVCSNVSNLSSHVSISSLYSDLSEVDRALVLDNFREATMRWNRLGREEEADGDVGTENERKSHVIVVTDACVPFLGSVESPLCGRMLINYELPTKKETYMRRMAACLSTDGIVINMVVGGEVVILNNLEESSGLVIAEMPLHCLLQADLRDDLRISTHLESQKKLIMEISQCMLVLLISTPTGSLLVVALFHSC